MVVNFGSAGCRSVLPDCWRYLNASNLIVRNFLFQLFIIFWSGSVDLIQLSASYLNYFYMHLNSKYVSFLYIRYKSKVREYVSLLYVNACVNASSPFPCVCEYCGLFECLCVNAAIYHAAVFLCEWPFHMCGRVHGRFTCVAVSHLRAPIYIEDAFLNAHRPSLFLILLLSCSAV